MQASIDEVEEAFKVHLDVLNNHCKQSIVKHLASALQQHKDNLNIGTSLDEKQRVTVLGELLLNITCVLHKKNLETHSNEAFVEDLGTDFMTFVVKNYWLKKVEC